MELKRGQVYDLPQQFGMYWDKRKMSVPEGI